MKYIKKYRPWDSQPQEASTPGEVTAGGLLVSGQALLNIASGYSEPDYVGGSGAPLPTVGNGGLGVRGATGRVVAWNGSGFQSSTDYTVFAVVTDDAGRGSIRNPIDCDGQTVGRVFQLRFSATSLPQFIPFNTAGSSFVAAGTVASSSSGVTVLAGRVRGNTASVWMNGQFAGSVAITGTARTVAEASARMSVGATLAASGTLFSIFGGQIYLSGYLPVALTDEEMQRLGTAPYSLAFAPRQIYIPRAAAGPSGNIYTINPSGGIALSGASSLRRSRIFLPSGGLALSGSSSLIRTRVQFPSGGTVFGGTAPVTYTPASPGNVYTITPSGGFALSGTQALKRERVFTPAGGISLSGTVAFRRERVFSPVGGVNFSGSSYQVRTRIIAPTGGIVFSGTAPMIFIPDGFIATGESRLTVGSNRRIRIS